MTKKKKLIFIDIDGCLTTGKNNPIPWQYVKSLQDAFKKFQPKFQYIIVTARPAPYAEAVIQFLGLMNTKNHQHAICESGTVYHLFGSNTFSVAEEVNIDMLINFEKDLHWLQQVYHFNIEDGRKRTMCVIAGKNQALNQLVETLKEYLPNGIGMHTSAGGIDFVPNKINKATAVFALAKKLNLSLEDAICIGDSTGDIPLMNIVGYPACPRNAGEKIKKLVKSRGGYIAKKEYSLGVIEILKYYHKSHPKKGAK